MSYAYDMPTMTRTAALASTMRVSVMRLSRRLRSERADHGLSLTQVATLATLDRHGPLTPRELADHEKVQPPSMTRILAGLEERALITRTPHASDGRQHLVALTAGRVRAAARGPPPPRRLAGAASRRAHPGGARRPARRGSAVLERITRS